MNFFLYIIIFIIGTLFGSFCTLAVYRIPRGEDIIYKHSYCPNCNHKLGLFDLFPILSYLFLRGKCRYCGKKIKIRYLLLEVLSGTVFVLFALALKVDFTKILTEQKTIIYYCIMLLYFVTLFIIAGIDKEKIQIQKSVVVFGLLVRLVYMIYVYILFKTSIYAYIILLTFILIFLIIDTYILKQTLKSNYALQILILSMYMLIYSQTNQFILTLEMTLFAIMFEFILIKIKEKIKKLPVRKEITRKQLPLGFYLCISNIIVLIISNYIK